MNNTMTIDTETFAMLIESQYADMISAAEKIGADYAEWKPQGKGRTILSQLQECAVRAHQVLGTLNGESAGGGPPSAEALAQYATFEDAIQGCRDTASALAAKLRTLSPDDLQKTITNRFGEFSFARLIVGAYWNASYHEGQIVYIGSLLEGSGA
ncbi:MAG: DinB family protein [Capsulimonas sp.]|uniref:DinB family protein n=1 Tax=Capsulimonas sp. TaxID=2494211 RepID=UPI003265BE4D